MACELCSAVFHVEVVMFWLCDSIIYDGANYDPFSPPELSLLLNTPEFASVLATLLVVTSEALLAQQQLAAATATASIPNTTAGSSTNSSNGCPGSSTPTVSQSRTATSSTTNKESTPEGRLVHRQVKGALKNLPQCTKALFETLNMDSAAAVWAAAAQRDLVTVDVSIIFTLAFHHLMRCLSPPAAEDVTVVMSPACEQARRRQLLLLVPATLLHWASNRRATTPKHMQARSSIAYFAGEVIRYWLGSSKVVITDLASGTGLNSSLNLQAYGPWQQPFFPAAWLEQVLPDIQKLLTVLLQQPGGLQPSSFTAGTSAEELAAEAPGQLVRLQCRILQSAFGRDEQGDIPAVGSGSELSTSKLVQGADEQEVVQALAEFRSVTVQTLASFESFIRASAQQLAAGSILDSNAQMALYSINAALLSQGCTKVGPLLCLAFSAGPGSPEQQQLYSLLSSLLKLSALGANSSDAALAQSLGVCCLIAAVSAMELLDLPQHPSVTESGSEGCSSSTATHVSATASTPPTSATSSSAAVSTAVTLLPSLVLIGRACLIWAQHLQQAVPKLLREHAGIGPMTPQQALEHRSFIASGDVLLWLCLELMQESQASGGSTTTACIATVSQVLNWLTAPAVAEQLAAAGHNTQQLPQLCQDLLLTNRTAAEAWPTDIFTEATAMALVQQLQVTGRALAGLAVPTMCCNPDCSNITGPSDLQLVSGRSCLCGGCRTARYCSRACQKAAWKQHKPACSAPGQAGSCSCSRCGSCC